MRLDAASCWERLRSSPSGVLSTVHPERGADPVPVVFCVVDEQVVVPIDTVKPKGAGRLQRLRNLDVDPRVALLVDHYEADWAHLWWVRVHAHAVEAPPSPAVLDALAAKYPAYRAPGTVLSTIVLTPIAITGWSANASAVTP